MSRIKPSYTEREYSPKSFLKYIERRVRKDIRLNKPIQPKDTIYLYNDGSKEFEVARHFLQSVFGKNLKVRETKSKEVKGKLVVPTNMDRYLSEKLQEFLHNTDKEEEGIPILDNVLEEEVLKVCEALGIKAEATEKSHPLIEKMQEKYPDTKFSLYRSFQRLQPASQQSSQRKGA